MQHWCRNSMLQLVLIVSQAGVTSIGRLSGSWWKIYSTQGDAQEKQSSSSSSSLPLATLKRPSRRRMFAWDPRHCSSWLAMGEFSYFLLSSLSLPPLFYFLPKVSFIVRANVRHQLQTPLINLAYELVSTSSVRQLESRKDCQMVSQICSVLCLTANGADPMTGFSDVVDTSP